MEKKSWILLSFLCLMVISFSLNIKEVFAKEILTLSEAEGIYFTRRGGGKPYSSDFYPLFDLSGKVAYCIEPGIFVKFHEYEGTLGMVDSPYDAETNRIIQLIGHYGYEYPGHDTIRYRMATQALIWEKTGGQIVEFYTERYGYGDYIDVSYERDEIMRLVNNHYNKPDFSKDSFQGYFGQTMEIEDKNNVLSLFQVADDGGNSVQIIGNKLYITPKTLGKSTINLRKAHYDSVATMVFTAISGVSQKVAILRAGDDVNVKINLETISGKVTLEKIDKDTKLNIPSGGASLKGAVYGVYDSKNNLVTKLTTNEKGIVTSGNLPSLGKYTLKELTPSLGYELDETVYNFEVTAENLNPKVKVYEQVKKTSVELYKVLGEIDSKELIGEPQVTFEIYLEGQDQVYKTVTTDKTGHVKFTLPYGKYVFKQKNTKEGYQKVPDFTLTIDGRDANITKTLYDVPIKAKLKIIKIDAETKEVIARSHIKFKLKDLKSNEYLCQNKTCTFETNEQGEVQIADILYGEYLLEEVSEKIDGYLWNQEKLKIKIDANTSFQDGNIVTIYFPNKRVKAKLIIEKEGEILKFENNAFYYATIPLQGVKFALYADMDIYVGQTLKYKKDELIMQVVTNKEGKIEIPNLELGKYYIVETESVLGHLVDKTKHYLEFTYQDQLEEVITQTIKLQNYLPKGKLEFLKVDSKTKLPLANALIEIYRNSPDMPLVFQGRTSFDGKIILEDLPLGEYFIKEIASPDGYNLSSDIITFDVTEDGEVIELQMDNTRTEIPVPKTSKDEDAFYKKLSVLVALVGLPITLYARKKIIAM